MDLCKFGAEGEDEYFAKPAAIEATFDADDDDDDAEEAAFDDADLRLADTVDEAAVGDVEEALLEEVFFEVNLPVGPLTLYLKSSSPKTIRSSSSSLSALGLRLTTTPLGRPVLDTATVVDADGDVEAAVGDVD
jgi:hypothetical protein